MELSIRQQKLVRWLSKGLPVTPAPYAEIANDLETTEAEILADIELLEETGALSRFGIVVRHKELGYDANAMVVWDIPDTEVTAIGTAMSQFDFVTLCYRRKRSLPHWPYNLYCMIHGKDRSVVEGQVRQVSQSLNLGGIQKEILFSQRRFKQRGGRYGVSVDSQVDLDQTDRAVINHLQDGFPICDEPYLEVATQLGMSETELLSRLDRLLKSKALSRFGPMYNAEKMEGAVTLAAMRVPPEEFDTVADKVNAHREAAHNYEREHELNMWFVLSTEHPYRIAEVIDEIEEETGLKVYNMPKSEEFFLRLKLEM